MSRPLVLLFGGQSSRDPGMFARLEGADPEIGARARARAARFLDGDPTDFSHNRTVQVSVLAVTLGWLELLERSGLRSEASAGLSLGEYAHLVDVGAIAADDALALVARRGELYDRGPSGAMAAIFPAPWDELGPLVERIAGAHGGAAGLAPAVFNSPTQTVVAGSRAAVDEVITAADAELYATGIVVEERIPMHTRRFEPVTAPFRAALEAAPWTGHARAPYRPNVTAAAAAADRATVVEHLARHVAEPVRWRDTVDALAAEHPDAVFLEAGARTVLRDLMLRRWHPDREVFALDDPDTSAERMRERARATLHQVAKAIDRGTRTAERGERASATAGGSVAEGTA